MTIKEKDRYLKYETYTVELAINEETGKVFAETWKKAGWEYGLTFCPHRPSCSVWNEEGKLIGVEYSDESGRKVRSIDINPEDGCIIKQKTFHENGEITTYAPRTKKIPFDPEPG